ncbi:MAG: molybdopterin-guanine dinucleotide biosynthesis protein B [Thermodesulfobacteriota bacterium]|nr:molybdopterin-guanine dinucleotide biosynthesis protein B [Thermodesulfobacteriota bacterium]
MPPIVSLVGRPDHGKTTLLEKLIPELNRRGYRIGTIKHHVHKFDMDKPGKDTWRHKQAGAHSVVLSSPTGLGLIRDVSEDTPVEELVGRYFSDVDLVIAEGYKRLALPKIEVFRNALADTPLQNRDKTWIGMVTDLKQEGDLPHFGLDDISRIADFLITTFIKPDKEQHVSLIVNGEIIPLNSFVQRFIAKSVTGMISSLKGCRDPKEIHLTIGRSKK